MIFGKQTWFVPLRLLADSAWHVSGHALHRRTSTHRRAMCIPGSVPGLRANGHSLISFSFTCGPDRLRGTDRTSIRRKRFDRLCGPIAFRAGRRAAHCSRRPACSRVARRRALLHWSLHGRVNRPQGMDVVCGVDDGCAGQSSRQQHGLDHRRY